MLNRIYNDYLMKDRYEEYRRILKRFIEEGYTFICIRDYRMMELKDAKYIIIRHDIDSDVNIAKELFKIEKELDIKSTYYFRLKTVNRSFMTEISEFGSEVGYHYEEIAQFCKDNKIIKKEYALENLNKIQEKFIENIKIIENENNITLSSIASHGDWVNRKINLTNKEIYSRELEKKLKLIEAYSIENLLEFRTADTMYPTFWKKDPELALEQNARKVLILVHPRWYKSAPIERFKLDLGRIIESIKFKGK